MKKPRMATLILVLASCLLVILITCALAATISSVTIQTSGSVTSATSTNITFVQGNAKGYTASYGTSISVAMGSAPTRGDVLIAVIGTDSAYMGEFCPVSSIVQTGVTWTKELNSTYVSSGTYYLDVEIWAGIVSSGASTNLTVNLSVGPSFGAVADVCEFSGLSGVVDKTAVNGGSGTTTNTGTTATTSQSKELWIGGISAYYTSQASPTNGFTLFDGATQPNLSVSYLEKNVSSTGAANSGTTISSSGTWAGCIATFLAGTPVLGVGSSANILCGQLSSGTYFMDSGTYVYGTSASSVIDSAISQVSALGNGHVILINGTWVLTTPIVAQSNVNLTCYSGVTICQNTPSSLSNSISLLLGTNGGISNFVVDGGTWNGNKGSLTDHRGSSTWSGNFFSYMGIGFDSSTQSVNITIENLTLENVIGQGIDLAECYNALVYNCTVINAGDNPITLDTSSSNSVVEYCTVVGGQDVGINTWEASNCTLQYNTVSNVTQYSGASHWGIAAEQSQYVNILNNTVSGCEYNIESTSNNTLVYGNIVNGQGYSNFGIQIATACNNIVSFNTVSGCTNAFGTYTAITQTLNLTLQGNIGFSGYYTLNLTLAGSGSGTVSESNAWCNQGLASISGNNWQFPTGTTIVLTATSASGSTFEYFMLTNSTTTTSNPLGIVINGNMTITAYFQ